MTSVLAKNAVDGRDVYPKKFLQVDSEGIPIQGQIPKKIATGVTSGVIDPLIEIQVLDGSAAPQAMTLPADLSNYIGRSFTITQDGATNRAHTITAAAAVFGGQYDTFTFDASAGEEIASVSFFVLSNSLVLVTGVTFHDILNIGQFSV
jgi:hypothetical protein